MLYRTAPVGLCLLDSDLRFVRINEELARINGLPLEQHYGRKVREVVPDIANEVERLCRRVLDTGKPIVNLDVERVDPDDADLHHHYLVSYMPLNDQQGQVCAVGMVVQEITERVRAEERLHFTQFSVDSCSTSIFWIRPDASFVYVNQAASRLFRFSRSRRCCRWEWPDIDPAYPDEAWPEYWDQIEREKTMTFETRIRHKDGTLIPVEITTNLLEFDGNEFVFAFVTDIRSRKEAERAVIQSEERFSSGLQPAVSSS